MLAGHSVVAHEVVTQRGGGLVKEPGTRGVDTEPTGQLDGGSAYEGVERPSTRLMQAPKRMGSWLRTPLVNVNDTLSLM